MMRLHANVKIEELENKSEIAGIVFLWKLFPIGREDMS